MTRNYSSPEICELEAEYLVLLAASEAGSDSSLEGYDDTFNPINW